MLIHIKSVNSSTHRQTASLHHFHRHLQFLPTPSPPFPQDKTLISFLLGQSCTAIVVVIGVNITAWIPGYRTGVACDQHRRDLRVLPSYNQKSKSELIGERNFPKSRSINKQSKPCLTSVSPPVHHHHTASLQQSPIAAIVPLNSTEDCNHHYRSATCEIKP